MPSPEVRDGIFVCQVLFPETRSSIFFAKCSSPKRGAAFFSPSALPRSAELHFFRQMLFAETRNCNFTADYEIPRRGSLLSGVDELYESGFGIQEVGNQPVAESDSLDRSEHGRPSLGFGQ